MFAAPTPTIPSSSSGAPLLAAGSRRRAPFKASAAASTFANGGRTTEAMSLYEILRVKRTASLTEIKTAYRSLAKLYHPDAIQESESDGRDFIEIHDAYETLSDPAARAVYDLSLNHHRHHHNNNTNNYCKRRGSRWETDQCW